VNIVAVEGAKLTLEGKARVTREGVDLASLE
jgi:hypothetical protein